MKHQPALILCGQIGDGETAAVAIVEAKPEVLAGPDVEWLGGQQHQLDDICAQRAFADHLCADCQRWRVQRPAGNFQAQVAAGMALTQQHLVSREWVGGRRGVGCEHLFAELARHHLDLARPAGAAPAGEGDGKTAGQHGVEQQLVGGFEGFARGQQFNDMAVVHKHLGAIEVRLLR